MFVILPEQGKCFKRRRHLFVWLVKIQHSSYHSVMALEAWKRCWTSDQQSRVTFLSLQAAFVWDLAGICLIRNLFMPKLQTSFLCQSHSWKQPPTDDRLDKESVLLGNEWQHLNDFGCSDVAFAKTTRYLNHENFPQFDSLSLPLYVAYTNHH